MAFCSPVNMALKQNFYAFRVKEKRHFSVGNSTNLETLPNRFIRDAVN